MIWKLCNIFPQKEQNRPHALDGICTIYTHHLKLISFLGFPPGFCRGKEACEGTHPTGGEAGKAGTTRRG